MKHIKQEILCAGQGGQGIMLMGKMLAYAGMKRGYNVTWIPSYGAEVRGGTAHSMVRIQNKEMIENPLVTNPAICVVMNKKSLSKFIGKVKPKGLLLVDSSQVGAIPAKKDILIKGAPFSKMAVDLGDKRVANMIALGAISRIMGLFRAEELIKCLPFILQKKKQLIKINEKAIKVGYELDMRS